MKGMKFFKHLLLMAVVALGFVLGACSSKNPNIDELKKNGKVHDAQIISIDSVKGECTYGFRFRDKEYTGHCLQPKEKPFKIEQFILILFLERDPSINIRLNDK